MIERSEIQFLKFDSGGSLREPNLCGSLNITGSIYYRNIKSEKLRDNFYSLDRENGKRNPENIHFYIPGKPGIRNLHIYIINMRKRNKNTFISTLLPIRRNHYDLYVFNGHGYNHSHWCYNNTKPSVGINGRSYIGYISYPNTIGSNCTIYYYTADIVY